MVETVSTRQPQRGIGVPGAGSLQARLADPFLTGLLEYRALRYVWMLNDHGYLPTVEEAEAYFEQPDRRQAVTPTQETMRKVAAMLARGPGSSPRESVLDYLLRLRWVETTSDTAATIRLTPGPDPL